MPDIKVGRYENPDLVGGWAGWIEPADRSWILFIAADGQTQFYPHRDENGGVIEEAA